MANTWSSFWIKEHFEEKNLLPPVKHRGGSLTLWVSYTASGVGKLAVVPGIMNSSVYEDILQEMLLSLSINWTFQEEGYFNRTMIQNTRVNLQWNSSDKTSSSSLNGAVTVVTSILSNMQCVRGDPRTRMSSSDFLLRNALKYHKRDANG